MAVEPVQLIVPGFSHPEFHGEIIAELQRLHDDETVRVIDALAVHKDADGAIEVQHLSNLTHDKAVEVGSTNGALIGVGIEGRRAPRWRSMTASTSSSTRRRGRHRVDPE